MLVKGFIYSILFSILYIPSHAHEGEVHESSSKDSPEQVTSTEVLNRVNKTYLSQVRPIFKKSCFDCHGRAKNLPWYYNVPIVKKMMKNDMSNAKKHLDMSTNFPFKGHGSPLEDLKSIKNAINKNTMPPWRYKLMHWNADLTKKEEQEIIDWINQSTKLIEDKE